MKALIHQYPSHKIKEDLKGSIKNKYIIILNNFVQTLKILKNSKLNYARTLLIKAGVITKINVSLLMECLKFRQNLNIKHLNTSLNLVKNSLVKNHLVNMEDDACFNMT